jgi:hypothetical protein
VAFVKMRVFKGKIRRSRELNGMEWNGVDSKDDIR